jgi:hypothetical protein
VALSSFLVSALRHQILPLTSWLAWTSAVTFHTQLRVTITLAVATAPPAPPVPKPGLGHGTVAGAVELPAGAPSVVVVSSAVLEKV